MLSGLHDVKSRLIEIYYFDVAFQESIETCYTMN